MVLEEGVGLFEDVSNEPSNETTSHKYPVHDIHLLATRPLETYNRYAQN